MRDRKKKCKVVFLLSLVSVFVARDTRARQQKPQVQRTTRDEKWFFSVAKLIQVRVCVMNVYGKDEEEDKKKLMRNCRRCLCHFEVN